MGLGYKREGLPWLGSWAVHPWEQGEGRAHWAPMQISGYLEVFDSFFVSEVGIRVII